MPEITNLPQPAAGWKNPRWGSLRGPDSQQLNAIFHSLENFLRKPKFVNGVELGDGTPGTKDPATGISTDPPTTLIDSITVSQPSAETVARLDALDADVLALETNPISGTRITDDSIESPKMRANSIGAREMAALYLSVGKYIRSSNYNPGVAGWAIDAGGTAEFNDVTIRNALHTGGTIRTATAGNRVELGASFGSQLRLYDGSYTYYGGVTASGRAATLHAPSSVSSVVGVTVYSDYFGSGSRCFIESARTDVNELHVNASGGLYLSGGQQVSRGLPDSAGVGFRQLRVPN